MAHNIDTSLLRAFVAVAETGGMTRAGLLLNLTQAAVSQQVKRLEDLLQSQLFEREKKKIKLLRKEALSVFLLAKLISRLEWLRVLSKILLSITTII